MVVMTPRETWTDERLDHFEKRVDERFDRVDERLKDVDRRLSAIEGSMRELRAAIKSLHDDNMATNRVMMQGFITISGAIVAGCVAVAGANAF
jgi:chromosome segregation ATPase